MRELREELMKSSDSFRKKHNLNYDKESQSKIQNLRIHETIKSHRDKIQEEIDED